MKRTPLKRKTPLKAKPFKKKAAKKAVKKKLPKKTTVRNRLDRLWSELVRSAGECQVCGTTKNLQAHHIVGRTNLAVRWDLMNGICLCPNCHTHSTILSAHGNPMAFAKWFESKHGEEYLEELQLRANQRRSYSVQDYLEMEVELKKEKESKK